MPPELENLLKQVQIEGTLNAKDFVSSIFFTDDSDYVKEFRNDFKNKFVQPLSRELKNVKPEDIKKILDPFGISKSSEGLAEDFKKYRENLKKLLNIDLPEDKNQTPKEKLKDTSVSTALPDKVQDVRPQDIDEQKTFGPKEILIALNDETKLFFLQVFDKIDEFDALHREKSRREYKYYDETLKNQEALIALSEGSGLLGTLAKLLAVGGVAALLVSTFWDSHIQPWLEEKFPNINWNFFDKFEGLVEGIGKFFTLGATGAGGFLLKIQGKVFESIADVLDNSIGSVLKAVLGESAQGGAGALLSGSAKVLSGSFFARIGANLFKGLGAVALKGIPYIGALISLGFAIDRFNKGDYVGGTIDLVGGLVNLIPSAGIPLSLGLAALNTFLDMKYGGTGDTPKENNNKLNFFGDIAKGIYGFLIKVPIIGGMVKGITNFYKFLYNLSAGDMAGTKAALEGMTAFPLLGALPSILLALLDVTSPTVDGGSKMSLPNFLDAFKQRVGKTVLGWFSWLPTSWQKSIAEFMGVPFEGTGDDEFSASNPEVHKKNMDTLKDTNVNQENIDIVLKNRNAALEEYKETMRKKDENDSIVGKYITGKYETYEKMANNLADEVQVLNEKILEYKKENKNFTDEDFKKGVIDSFNSMIKEIEQREKTNGETETVKVEDFYKPASGKSTLIYDQDTGKRYQTASNDDVFALRPDGVFDKALKEIQMVAFDINKNIKNLNESITSTQKQTSPSVFNVNNSSGSGYTGKEYLMENERDAIFNDRVKWLVYSQNIRATT